MTYIVTGTSSRKEFDSIHEAMKIRSEAEDIYFTDAFGNASKLDDAKIQELLANEPKPESAKAPETETPEQPQAAQPQMKTQVPDTQVTSRPQEKTTGWQMWAKWILGAAVVIMLLYFIIKMVIPAILDGMNIYNNVIG